ncbi:vesicle-trafficking protein sec22b [Anaeramoeba ignava]|uniref:Vesicle-trafficking protein sec22b n=1 Tax=Anaeramoeba ignava TaxID=1746090 RepID=A0A9Q0LYH7_ANAIG|nr:vesicle-trafficking protein sec22b [Anaeramoeba ignava]|eukprot:Anaeramoba_ignava/c19809_g1_i2.p2 GENE.c19809_g1_i2~~c19809_g1_i2.p2  ORF type:complete len:219 (-),score=68.46 c19809_g1_i2:829-1485(-)
MALFTNIARIQDGLLLCSDSDEEADYTKYQNYAKQLFQKLEAMEQKIDKFSIEESEFTYHYYIANGVCYLGFFKKNYPYRAVFAYLKELEEEFRRIYNQQEIEEANRSFTFIKFESVIRNLRQKYTDDSSLADKNIQQLSENLTDVQRIITKNIKEVLERGEKLETLNLASSKLSNESKVYAIKARNFKWRMWWKTYSPLIIIAAIVFLVLFIKFFIW